MFPSKKFTLVLDLDESNGLPAEANIDLLKRYLVQRTFLSFNGYHVGFFEIKCEPRFQFLGLSCVIVGYYASHGDEYPPGKILNFMSPSLKRFELPHCLLPIYLSSIFS
jgi:hypothetical protein